MILITLAILAVFMSGSFVTWRFNALASFWDAWKAFFEKF